MVEIDLLSGSSTDTMTSAGSSVLAHVTATGPIIAGGASLNSSVSVGPSETKPVVLTLAVG